MKTAKEFLQHKYPSMKLHWNETNIDDNWVAQMMEEYAHQAAIKQREAIALWMEDSAILECPLVTGKPI